MTRLRAPAIGLVAAAIGLVVAACGSSPPEPEPYPIAWSWSTASGRSVDLRFLLPVSSPNCQTDAVSVTGPGLAAPRQLSCSETGKPQFATRVDLGPTGPAPPLDYTFTARLGSATTTHVATVDCYLDLPIGVTPAPSATVPSPVAIGWMPPPGKTGIQYDVAVSGPESRTASVVDQSSVLMYLLPGDYLWQTAAVPIGLHDGSSALHCGSEWSTGAFTVR